MDWVLDIMRILCPRSCSSATLGTPSRTYSHKADRFFTNLSSIRRVIALDLSSVTTSPLLTR